MKNLIKQAATDLANSKRLVALTGAGISVESHIPPFRGKGGVWERFDPIEYAHIDAFMENPKKVWNVLLKEMKEIIEIAQPNDAHLGLARLERLGRLKTIITQNVDGLHQKAGNTDVIEFHGSFARNRCLNCQQPINTEDIVLDTIPPKCVCGGIYRPEVIFFGETIPPEHLLRSRQLSSICDVMLVMGTSAVVQPAATIPVIAKEAGAIIIEVNPEKTPLTHTVSDYLIQGKAGEAMNRIMESLAQIL